MKKPMKKVTMLLAVLFAAGSAMFKRSERNPVIDAMYTNGLADRAHELLHIEYKD